MPTTTHMRGHADKEQLHVVIQQVVDPK